MNPEQVFNNIYEGNRWGGKKSISGTGSDEDQTKTIIKELPTLIEKFAISSILDAPCGDFYWMKEVSLERVSYLGVDVVDELIKHNQKLYAKGNIQFRKINLLRDKLLEMDLILCRDCLVHFSFKDIFLALDNICNSHSKYLLTTTFPDREMNQNIQMGQWRPLNLQAFPFSLPQPCAIINEQCTEGGGAYSDKSLALWSIDTIREHL